jgi:hypothetical protein
LAAARRKFFTGLQGNAKRSIYIVHLAITGGHATNVIATHDREKKANKLHNMRRRKKWNERFV